MNAVVQVLAIVEGLLLIGIGVLEAFFYRDQRFYRMFRIRPEHHKAVRLWTVNVGFYNIVYGLSFFAAVIIGYAVDEMAARTLLVVLGVGQAILGVVLWVSEPKLWLSAIAQMVLPAAIVVAALM
ncbi:MULTISPECIES: DUF1304 family protein [unclassified Diaminobutyricimonas]|uniref:DUF1304 family protein n=1 Tax=unclassified Diaminobutyricimonas TaxID=2643261 RepID=UPI0012F4A3C1|nr:MULTISPECIES: DUF1304 family protein [unclassified Diaminobutyricimonas]